MRIKTFLRLLEAARLSARQETTAMSQRSKYASAMASEGWVGGYLAALNDVEAVLVHGYPSDPRLYWDKALQKERSPQHRRQG